MDEAPIDNIRGIMDGKARVRSKIKRNIWMRHPSIISQELRMRYPSIISQELWMNWPSIISLELLMGILGIMDERELSMGGAGHNLKSRGKYG